MAIRKPDPKKLKTCPVGLALLALEPKANPLEMAVESLDPAPAALDIDMHDQASGCPRHRYACIECGLTLREGCYNP